MLLRWGVRWSWYQRLQFAPAPQTDSYLLATKIETGRAKRYRGSVAGDVMQVRKTSLTPFSGKIKEIKNLELCTRRDQSKLYCSKLFGIYLWL